MPRIGIDLGGTKIEGIVLERDDRISQRLRIATPAGDYRATIDAVAGLVRDLEVARGERCSVGVGTPGAPSPQTGRLRNANSTCLNDRPIEHDLAMALDRPIRIANDADCFTLSEAADGAAVDASCVFGVIVGTGTGGGIVVRGVLLNGPNAIAGEWGHNPLPWADPDETPGPRCYCGKHGCIETFLSGPGMALDFAQHGGERHSAIEIVRLADAGDARALDCVRRYVDRMARSLASVINLLDPDVIVLGGGMSNISRLYHSVPQRWVRYVFSDVVRTRLIPPMHGDSSGVRGAARLWPAE